MKTLRTERKINGSLTPVSLLVSMLAVLIAIPCVANADLNIVSRLTTNSVNNNVVESESIFSDLNVISGEELGGMRGGFKVGGLDINIGAIVRTYIDGRLALHSHLTVADDGSLNNSIVTAVSSEISGATVISNNDNGPTLQDASPAGINLDGLEGSEGVVVNDDRGYTATLQNVQQDRFLTTIVNQASGRDIEHRVNVDVTIRNFTELQKSARSMMMAHRFTLR